MGAAAKGCHSPYESARNLRIQENKRRLQELGLTDLSRDLNSSVASTRTSPSSSRAKPRVLKEKVKFQLRRSSRNSGVPQPEYVEVEIDIRRRARFDNTGGTRHYSRLYERKYASDEARMSSTEKAEALKKLLPETHGSFVKPMLQSHVTGGFWLGLPVAFCRDYLPKRDDRIVLEDENNEEWETIYLSNKTGLSGGWRGFSLDHGLVDGDALVFELVEPKRFKVHIIRVYGDEDSVENSESDVKEQGPNTAEKANCNKVRQRLIWETESDKGTENKVSDATKVKIKIDGSIQNNESAKERKQESDDEFVCDDVKPRTTANNCRIVKEEMECSGHGSEKAKYDGPCNIKIEAGHDIKNYMPSKRLKTVTETGGFEDVKKARLLDATFGEQCRNITSYLRSKKPMDVNVKKEMQTGDKGIGVC